MNANLLTAGRTHAVRSFIRRHGLADTAAKLEIMGLEKLVTSKEISTKNKELIFRFLNHISAEVSEGRLTFYTHKLRRLAAWLKKDFRDVTEDDLRALLTFLTKGNARDDGGTFSPGTLHGYKVTIKRFYRWLEGDDDGYPRKVKWIKTNGETVRIKDPDQLLSNEEVIEMIRHAGNPRDKAMVSFLYESGARISEMLSMQIRHLEFRPDVVKAVLPISKTTPRVIPLVSCKKHLVTWVNYHPLKEKPDVALWSNLKGEGQRPLTCHTVNQILKRIAKRAGITKRIYPHLFRACSVTHKQASGWREPAIKAFHGLSKDSKMMRHYSHLSYNDLENVMKETNGLPVEGGNKVSRGIKCPRCGRSNPLTVQTCACGLPAELKNIPYDGLSLECEIKKRVEKEMEEFIESRQFYDRFLKGFLSALVTKAGRSPEMLKALGEIESGLRNKGASMTSV